MAKGALRGVETGYSAYEDRRKEMTRARYLLKGVEKLECRFQGRQGSHFYHT